MADILEETRNLSLASYQVARGGNKLPTGGNKPPLGPKKPENQQKDLKKAEENKPNKGSSGSSSKKKSIKSKSVSGESSKESSKDLEDYTCVVGYLAYSDEELAPNKSYSLGDEASDLDSLSVALESPCKYCYRGLQLEGSSKKGSKPSKPSRPSRPSRGPTALLYDTGSTVHIVNSRSLFTNLVTTGDFGYL
jgi:hypothetical protein